MSTVHSSFQSFDVSPTDGHRCINIRVRCGGYRDWSSLENTSPTSSSSSSFPIARSLHRLPSQSARERTTLEYFYFKIAPRLGGYFYADFWNRKVLSLSLDEPAVRTALVAFSSLYSIALKRSGSTETVTAEDESFAIEYHNRAIRELMAKLENPGSIRVPLTVCLLFFCIDSLRGQIASAMRHISGGLKLLRIWKRRYGTAHLEQDPQILRSDFDFIENELVIMFGWLNQMTTRFGAPSCSCEELSATTSSIDFTGPFISITQAKITLVNLVHKSLLMIKDPEYKNQLSNNTLLANTSILPMQPEHAHNVQPALENVATLFDNWTENFERLVRDQGHNWSAALNKGAKVLKACCLTMALHMRGHLHKRETDWDSLKDKFEEIVRCTEAVVNDMGRYPDTDSKFFSFEVGMVPALQLVVSKCRYGSLRRRALAVLRACPLKEAIYDSKDADMLSTRVMELEEASIAGLEPGTVPRDDQLPSEESRITQVDIPSFESTIQGSLVRFMSRPMGLNGPLQVYEEYVLLHRSHRMGEDLF
jgi:hypothetical protein